MNITVSVLDWLCRLVQSGNFAQIFREQKQSELLSEISSYSGHCITGTLLCVPYKGKSNRLQVGSLKFFKAI